MIYTCCIVWQLFNMNYDSLVYHGIYYSCVQLLSAMQIFKNVLQMHRWRKQYG